jgi:hypothetical protein
MSGSKLNLYDNANIKSNSQTSASQGKTGRVGMLRIATKTKLTPEEAIEKALKFFGPEGYKLTITGQTDTSAGFEGGGGTVAITACAENGKTDVELFSREWDYQVKEFIRLVR